MLSSVITEVREEMTYLWIRVIISRGESRGRLIRLVNVNGLHRLYWSLPVTFATTACM